MTSVQHNNKERGTSLSLLANHVPSKRACCFDVPDLIIDSTMPGLTKRWYSSLASFDGYTKDEIEADQSKWLYSLPLEFSIFGCAQQPRWKKCTA